MRHLAYVGMLAFCFLGTLPLELWLGVRVYRQTRRLLLTLLPVAAVFVVWDLYAIAQGHWDFDPEQTLGVLLPGGVPVEEMLFFLVIPACAVLSFEAVRRVKGWPAGDE
ncbi:MAG TPA: lycopene cyclase domain-containing protein [Actinomycetes bacterium]|nr:lycopene cyclase domain-containing protein [Actinomycetes bacterium]